MNHTEFKEAQIAAAYVARALDEDTQEAFELHLMTCGECLDDVEHWRALRKHLPATPARADRSRWRLAASLVAVASLGGLAGWIAHSYQAPPATLDETLLFVALQPLTRAADPCTAVPLGGHTRAVVLRIPGASGDQRVVARGMSGAALSDVTYTVRLQADGSWLVTLPAETLRAQGAEAGVAVELRSADGTVEALGCLRAESGRR